MSINDKNQPEVHWRVDSKLIGDMARLVGYLDTVHTSYEKDTFKCNVLHVL